MKSGEAEGAVRSMADACLIPGAAAKVLIEALAEWPWTPERKVEIAKTFSAAVAEGARRVEELGGKFG